MSGSARSASPVRGALSSRNFRLLALGHALSATAQSLPVIALAVYVYDRTGSPAWVAAATAVRLVPPIAFSALGGLLGDAYDRRTVMVWCNVFAAGATAAVAVLAGAGAGAVAVLALAFVAASVATAHYPSLVASVPSVASAGQLEAANLVVSTVESAAFMVGPALGGLALAAAGPAAVLAADAVLFLAAAAVVCLTHRWDERSAVLHETASSGSLGSWLREGWEAVGDRRALPVVVVSLATELLYGCTVVLLVLVATRPAHAGTLNAAFGLGVIAAIALASRLARTHRPAAVLVAATVLSGLPVAALAVTADAPLLAAVLLVGCGVATAVAEVEIKTLLQRTVDDGVMARFFGMLDGLACAAILAGTLLTPVLVNVLGLVPTLLLVGVALPAAAVVPLTPLATRSLA